jgi:hypothetical protein
MTPPALTSWAGPRLGRSVEVGYGRVCRGLGSQQVGIGGARALFVGAYRHVHSRHRGLGVHQKLAEAGQEGAEGAGVGGGVQVCSC